MAKVWKYSALLLIAVLALGVFVLPANAEDPNSEYGGSPHGLIVGGPGDPTTPEEYNDGTVLLIQDDAPWGVNANHHAFDELGISYDVINSASLATHNLTQYHFIVFASDQRNSYYNNIAANMAKINDYVGTGGLLLAHCCDGGWQGGSWIGFSILPGGVTHVKDSSGTIEIVAPNHPVVTGNGAFTLTEDYLSGWNSSTHGYFTDLVSNANVVMQSPDGPTYIDYRHGNGRVLATMQTIEWGYIGNFVDRPELLLNEFRFAQQTGQQADTGQAKPRVSVRTPASMSIQSLGISPKQVYVNKAVTITTNVANTGGQAGSLSVILKINNKVEQTKPVSVGPLGTQPVQFTVTKAEPGTYIVDIGGQKGTFTVLGTGGSTAGTGSSSDWIAALIIGALVIAAVVVLLLIFR